MGYWTGRCYYGCYPFRPFGTKKKVGRVWIYDPWDIIVARLERRAPGAR